MNKYQEAIEVIDTLLHLMCGEEREDGYKPTMEEMSNSMDLLKDLANKAEELGWLDEKTCTNESEYNLEDGFECSNCGIIIENYNEIEIDEDNPEDRCMKEYAPRYCPNCGRKIVD